jgi:hypothetical protein
VWKDEPWVDGRKEGVLRARHICLFDVGKVLSVDRDLEVHYLITWVLTACRWIGHSVCIQLVWAAILPTTEEMACESIYKKMPDVKKRFKPKRDAYVNFIVVQFKMCRWGSLK